MSFGDTAGNRDMAEHIRVFIRLPVLRYALNRQPSSPLGEHESGIYVPNLCIPHKTIARSNAVIKVASHRPPWYQLPLRWRLRGA